MRIWPITRTGSDGHVNEMEKFILAVLVVIFAALSLYGMRADLPYSRVANEVEQIKFAVKFGSGDFNPHYFFHPPCFAYLLFIIYGIFFVAGRSFGIFGSVAEFERLYFTDPTVFYMIARSVIVLIGAASLIVFYLVGRKIFDKKTAVIAVLFMAVSPVYVKWAHYATSDIPLLFLALASFYFTISIFKEARWRDYILAGLALGLCIAAKYNGVLMIAPIIMAHLFSPAESGWKKKAFSAKLLGLFVFAAAGFFIANPFAVIDHKTFLSSLAEQSRRMNAADYNFASWRTDKSGWIYILTDTIPFGLGGWVPAVLALAGIAYSAFRRTKEDLILLSLVLVSYLAMGRWDIIKPRYFIFVFPALFLLSARFLTESAGRITAGNRNGRILLYAVVLLVVLQPLCSVFTFDVLVSAKPVNVQAKEWIESNIPHGSAIVVSTKVPLVPDRVSITRTLKRIYDNRMGEGVMLKKLSGYTDGLPATYDLYELPYPWREDFDKRDFDFKRYRYIGVRYFTITEEAEEYATDPARYSPQLEYIDAVRGNCRLMKEFRRQRPEIEPGYTSDYEYVQIYEYRK